MLAMVSLSKLFEKHLEKYGREGLERSPQTPCIVKGLGGIKAWILLLVIVDTTAAPVLYIVGQ